QHDENLQQGDNELIDHVFCRAWARTRPAAPFYLSTSPRTMSMEPISATTSATRCPRTRRRNPCRLQNDGGRTRKRYGLVDLPSLTMKYPSSPFGDSIA